MFGLGFGELIIVFIIALIFIGPKKLPELAKGLGQGLKEFQKAAKGFSDQMQETVKDVKDDTTPQVTDYHAAPNASQQPEEKVVPVPEPPKDPSHS
jgi:TatA/E family protein of Tat protein translocase